MFKRWRCYVALLLCLCCTFATLSLNTLQVEAAQYQMSIDKTFSYNYVFANGRWGTSPIVSGSIYNGTGSITSGPTFSGQNGLTVHVKQPVQVIQQPWSGSWTPTMYFTLFQRYDSFSVSGATVSAIGMYDENGRLLPGISFRPCNEIALIDNGVNYGFSKMYYLEYDLTLNNTISSSGSDNNSNLQCSVTFHVLVDVRPSTSQEIEVSKEAVNDSGTQGRLDTQIQQEITAQTTRTGILNQITSFFGSFFENIINALKSLFIPEDGYFTNWFTRLNNLLSAKLGMLYAPFDLVISVLTALGTASTSEAGIPFPELAWDGQVIIPAQTFYFSSLGSSFSDLRDAVYFGTDVVLLFAFLVLLQRKINLVMRGSEEG